MQTRIQIFNRWIKYVARENSMNQTAGRGVWQLYGEGERFRLAQET